MNSGFALLALVSLLPYPEGRTAETHRLPVFILAGQSNMEGQSIADLAGPDYNDGRGTLEDLWRDPVRRAPFRLRRNPDGQWAAREDVWVRYQLEDGPLKKGPLSLGFTPYDGRHHFGPEFQFGQVLGDHFDSPVLLIKTAWGGKSLYRDFRPPRSGGRVGPYFNRMLAEIRQALTDLPTDFPALAGYQPELAGFVWYQGWNDGCEPAIAVPQYEQNLVHLIQDVRQALQAPHLPVVIGELTGPWRDAPPEWSALRQAQAAAATRPEFHGNVTFVSTRNFVRSPEDSPNPGHGHHEFGNAETGMWVGDALARGMLALLGTAVAQSIDPSKPTCHVTRVVAGWTVRVDDRLLAAPHDVLGHRALKFLEAKLTDLVVVLPAEALAALRQVTLVLDWSHGNLRSAQYHPSADWLAANHYSSQLAKCVHFPQAADLPTRRNINEQPWVVLHELAHAYHDQVLGFDHPQVAQAYERFRSSGRGQATLRYDGERAPHYALTDPQEFFAEMTEAYFGMNDFYPFNQAELRTAEPEIHTLLRQLWEPPPASPALPPTRSTPESP